MKKIIPFIISLLFCVNICAQERMQVRTDNAPLLPFPQLMNNKSEYKDIELLKKDWPLYWLRKGTEVTVLDFYYYRYMVRVRLDDGSEGFMPTAVFASGDDMYYVVESGSFDEPKGTYRLAGMGAFRHKNQSLKEGSVEPEYYVFRNIDNGKRYKQEELSFKALETFASKHPKIKEYHSPTLHPFKPRKGLPLSFIGCSKSYIETVLGPAVSYIGPGLSQYSPFTFAIYRNFAWDTEESKKRDDAGLVIYFDENMKAVHMEKKPLYYYYNDFFTALYTPLFPVESYDAGIVKEIAARKRPAPYIYNNVAPHKEQYTAPGLFDRLRIGSMYVIENKLGIENRWAIMGILMAFCMAIATIINLCISVDTPLSNKGLKRLVHALNAPFVIYAMIYISRFYIIAAILAGIVIYVFAEAVIEWRFSDIDRNRCDKCKKWNKPALMVDESFGEWYLSSKTPKLTDTWIYISRDYDTSYEGNRRTDWSMNEKNYKTTLQMSQSHVRVYECKHCHHRWSLQGTKNRDIPGPICYVYDSSGRDTIYETEVTTEQTRNRRTGEILDEREVGRRTVSRKGGGQDYHSTRYDTERYNIYLNRYLNGDYLALVKYELEFYGKYRG